MNEAELLCAVLVNKMIYWLDHLSYEERLKILGVFSLRKDTAKGGMIKV